MRAGARSSRADPNAVTSGWVRRDRETTKMVRVKAVYSDNGSGDWEAVPGVHSDTGDERDLRSQTIEVDGEMFTLRAGEFGGTDYTWLSGPNPGYGFTMSPTADLSLDEHRQMIRDFLAMVDPATGYIEDN